MSSRTKAVALAIAILTLPVLGNRTCAYYFTNQSIAAQSTPANQARTKQPADIVSASRTNLPLTLIIETVVAGLLLVSLIAAYLSNRAMRPLVTAAATAEKSGQGQQKLPAAFVNLYI